MQKALKNLRLLRYQFFFWGWLPENVILILYFNQVLDSYALAGFVFMLRYWAISLFEIPTGIISDRFGRRNTLILSAVSYALVKVFYILAFWTMPLVMLLLSSVFYGLAESLTSGTNNATVYENVQKLQAKDFTDYFSKIKAYHVLGVGTSALVGGIIASAISMYAVMWVGFAGTLAHIYFSWRLTETGFTPSHKKVFHQFWTALVRILRDRKLRPLFFAEIINQAGARSQRDIMPAYLGTLIPYWGMGLWRFGGRLTNFVGFWFVKIFINRWGIKKSFIYSIVSGPISIFIGTLFNNILTPFIFLGDYLLHGIGYTAQTKIKQDGFNKTQRATMESIYSMAGNICAGIAVLIIGIIGDHTNAMIAIWAALAIKFISFPFYFRVVKNTRR